MLALAALRLGVPGATGIDVDAGALQVAGENARLNGLDDRLHLALGGPDSLMIGKVLWQEFFNNRDWPVASAVAIVMLVLLIVPIMIFHRYQSKEMESRLT